MARLRICLAIALALSVAFGTLTLAQEDDATPTPSPTAKAKASPTKKKKKSAKASPSPSPKKSPKAPSKKEKSSAKESGEEANSSPDEKKSKSSPSPKDDDAATADGEASTKPKKSPSPVKEGEEEAGSSDDDEANPSPTAKVEKSSETAGKSKKKKGKKSPSPSPSKKKKKKSKDDDAEPEKTPKPSPGKSAEMQTFEPPLPSATPTIEAVLAPAQPFQAGPADITIEKSGLEEDQGYEPPPPTPARRGFWMFRKKEANYRYLSNYVIEAIRKAPVRRGRWKLLVVHNSGSRQGNARVFEYYHRRVKRMRNGMAYHFVVGNGTSTGNGQIEIGDRWRRQINGGHVHSDYLNNIGIGICLVGDFNRDQPTRSQLEATDELIRYLRERCGKSEGRILVVRPHKAVNPPRWSTDCPGDAFPYSWLGRFR